MPRLTVIMPAKNAVKTIGLAIRSTLRAMPKDSQLVVWNDASDDGTAEEVTRIRDARLSIMNSPVSIGGGGGRQEVMRTTDSELIAGMDADDYCLPWRFSKQLPSLAQVDVSFGAAIWFGPTIRQLKLTTPRSYNAESSRLSLLFHNPFSHPTVIARRAAIDQVGGYSNMRVAQDYELWLRAAAHGLRLGRTGIPTVGYRQSVHQVSRADDFATRIRSEPQLWASYQLLADSLFPNAELWKVASPGDIDSAHRTAMFAALGARLGSMEVWNQRYYGRAVASQTGTLIGASERGNTK